MPDMVEKEQLDPCLRGVLFIWNLDKLMLWSTVVEQSLNDRGDYGSGLTLIKLIFFWQILDAFDFVMFAFWLSSGPIKYFIFFALFAEAMEQFSAKIRSRQIFAWPALDKKLETFLFSLLPGVFREAI